MRKKYLLHANPAILICVVNNKLHCVTARQKKYGLWKTSLASCSFKAGQEFNHRSNGQKKYFNLLLGSRSTGKLVEIHSTQKFQHTTIRLMWLCEGVVNFVTLFYRMGFQLCDRVWQKVDGIRNCWICECSLCAIFML